jgi:hypothetical protein
VHDEAAHNYHQEDHDAAGIPADTTEDERTEGQGDTLAPLLEGHKEEEKWALLEEDEAQTHHQATDDDGLGGSEIAMCFEEQEHRDAHALHEAAVQKEEEEEHKEEADIVQPNSTLVESQ